MTLTDDEIVALQHGLPSAWQALEDFASDSVDEDPHLAAAHYEMAATLRKLYDRLP